MTRGKIVHATEAISFVVALLMGLAGSAHCFGMCGSIAGAFGVRNRTESATTSTASLHGVLQQAGRLTSYSVLGFLSGALGQGLQNVFDFAQIGAVLRIASGILLLLVAARILLQWNALVPLERAGAKLWRAVQSLTRRIAIGGVRQSYVLGLAWGFLPCGMVYSMLAFAALSGSALHGAALMLVFGLGTAPSMFASTLLASGSAKFLSLSSNKWATALVLAGFGIWMIVAPFYMQMNHIHVH
jgi:sulfite exporter TauE/SafE